jgi:hypothetical protein
MTKQVFSETQRLRQAWVWLVLVGVFALVFWQIFKPLFRDEPLQLHIVQLLSLLLVAGLVLLFLFSRLKTRIDQECIRITYFPLIIKPRVFRWEDIDQAYVKKYNSFLDFGGWGIRFSSHGKAYNTSGNRGLQLILKSGDKILIGTQKAEELDAYLKKYIFTEKID